MPGLSSANGQTLYISACRPGCKTHTGRVRCGHSYSRLLVEFWAKVGTHAEAGGLIRASRRRATTGRQAASGTHTCCRLLLSTELYSQWRTLRAVDSFAISFAIKRARGNRHETIHQGLQCNIFTSLSRRGL